MEAWRRLPMTLFIYTTHDFKFNRAYHMTVNFSKGSLICLWAIWIQPYSEILLQHWLEYNASIIYSPIASVSMQSSWRRSALFCRTPLLSIIAFGDKRLVVLTEEEAEELLTRESSIKTALQHAWKEGSFREVRELGIFNVLRRFFWAPDHHRRNPLACGARNS